MGLFRRRRQARQPAPDIVDLRLNNDVAGLVGALQSDSSEVAGRAAQAIATTFEHEGEPYRSQAAATSPALLAALASMRARAAVPARTSTLQDPSEANTATWHLIDALGTIRSAEAAPVLTSLVADTTADVEQRIRAANALGGISDPACLPILSRVMKDPRINRAIVLSSQPAELADAAATALARLGELGVSELCEAAQGGGAASATALAALRRLGPADPGVEQARSVLAQADHRKRMARREQQARQEADAAAAALRRRDQYPHAADLADRLGHPEWLTEAGVLRPDSYAEALASCRSLGLAVAEHEEDVDAELSDVWATVRVADAVVVIDGGRGPRDVLY